MIEYRDMSTDTTIRKAIKPLFPTVKLDFNALMVVYQLQDGTWRGFAAPYGETTEAGSKKEAIKKIRILTAAYHDTMHSYGSPHHLKYAGLADVSDRAVYDGVLSRKSFMEEIHKAGKVDTENVYVEAYRCKS